MRRLSLCCVGRKAKRKGRAFEKKEVLNQTKAVRSTGVELAIRAGLSGRVGLIPGRIGWA